MIAPIQISRNKSFVGTMGAPRPVNRASVLKWRAKHALRSNVPSPSPPGSNRSFGERFAFAHAR